MSVTVPVRVLQGEFSQKHLSGSVLRSGSVVTGRVLSRAGDGSFIVSIAGQKIAVKSEANLKAGQVFSARVKIVGNQVALSLVQETKNDSAALVQKFSGSSQNLSPEIQNFLMSLGFEPNSESFRILQFMQQVGMKIDAEGAKKALNHSKKGGAVDEEKAQVALLFDEKGIASDEEKIEAVIGRNERGGHGENPSGGEKNPQRQNHHAEVKNAESVKKSVRNYFEQVDSASITHPDGILTAFNTVLSSATKNPPLKHWILLPFEWNFNNYSGDIRLLFDSDLKKLEKVIVRLENESVKRIFALFYKGGKVASVKFASSVEADSSETNALSSMIYAALGKGVDVSAAKLDELKGFCAEDESIKFVRGAF